MGEGLFDQQGWHAILPKGALELLVLGHLVRQFSALSFQRLAASLQVVEDEHLLFGGAYFHTSTVFLLLQVEQVSLSCIQVRRLGLSRSQGCRGVCRLLLLALKLNLLGSDLRLQVSDLAIERRQGSARFL